MQVCPICKKDKIYLKEKKGYYCINCLEYINPIKLDKKNNTVILKENFEGKYFAR
jgi:hypothetical protein